MGLEGEDFIGNPNKVEYTDDELEDEDVGPDLWLEQDQEIWDDEEHDEDWAVERQTVRNFLLDYAGDNDDTEDDDGFEPYEEFFSDGDTDDDDDELRLTMINGSLVQVTGHSIAHSSPRSEDPSAASASDVVVNDIDNNEVVKAASEIAPSDTNSEDGEVVVAAPQS